jgi:hypothetical protein
MRTRGDRAVDEEPGEVEGRGGEGWKEKEENLSY